MKKIWFSTLITLPTIAFAQSEASICINEIMQSNIDCLMIEHDFPDSWVELYNPTDDDIALKGYFLGTTNDVMSAYQFISSDTIYAHGYFLILCDKNATELHTDFRLESTSGGTLYLFDATESLVASLSYPAMLAPNIAYGRSLDGFEEWGWELTPTPGSTNEGGFSTILLPEPIFSMKGQVMTSSASLSITMPDGDYPDDTKIYLTTDGKEPTASSSSGTEFTFDITENTVIRAKLISESALSRRSTANSYIFHPRTTSLPIISILTDEDYLYSDSVGILSSARTNNDYNFNYDWRRPVNTEYFDASNGSAWFNQLGEVAVGGNYTRSINFAQKSLKLYANKRFGTKNFKGTFWDIIFC
ncbi:MAG: lamin tail domain-containing protein [Alphaproteobacteria bacterium]|nr:lamin tail domain-containing protein [Alphaproteobacteria bacterium]